jgi:hypothetical protein
MGWPVLEAELPFRETWGCKASREAHPAYLTAHVPMILMDSCHWWMDAEF